MGPLRDRCTSRFIECFESNLPAGSHPEVVDPRQLTEHARRRCQQRSITPEHLELAILYGLVINQLQGRTAFWLNRRHWRVAKRQAHATERSFGVAVVVAADGAIVTAFRCKDRLRKVLRRAS